MGSDHTKIPLKNPCQVPIFLQDLSFLLTRSFCPLNAMAVASFARPTFAYSLRDFHSFYAAFAFSNWSTEMTVVHVYLQLNRITPTV